MVADDGCYSLRLPFACMASINKTWTPWTPRLAAIKH